jgi:hypothetical protein
MFHEARFGCKCGAPPYNPFFFDPVCVGVAVAAGGRRAANPMGLIADQERIHPPPGQLAVAETSQ